MALIPLGTEAEVTWHHSRSDRIDCALHAIHGADTNTSERGYTQTSYTGIWSLDREMLGHGP